MDFAENLRSELDYQGLIVKELAAKSGINIHTLNNYLSGKKTMPPADAAVKIAASLGVTVEYLITGAAGRRPNIANTMLKYLPLRDVMNDLLTLPEDTLEPIKAMIKTAANREKKKRALSNSSY
jgi:transcriptional regulator with XRE-family HTH domain